MLTRGFMRSVWLLKPTMPSAGAGAAAQVPTQCLLPCIGRSSLLAGWRNRAAAIAPAAMVLIRGAARPGSPRRRETLRPHAGFDDPGGPVAGLLAHRPALHAGDAGALPIVLAGGEDVL